MSCARGQGKAYRILVSVKRCDPRSLVGLGEESSSDSLAHALVSARPWQVAEQVRNVFSVLACLCGASVRLSERLSRMVCLVVCV